MSLLVFLTLMGGVAIEPLAAAPRRILVHGHRGARAVLPENTMPAFEYAIRAGADVLELDLAVTKDDELVVSHDPVLNSKICIGPRSGEVPIRELTLRELKQWDCGALKNPEYPRQQPVPGTRIPTLDEVFSLAPRGNFEFNVETKIFKQKPEFTPSPERFSQLVADCVRRHGLESRVILQSFDFRTLEAMKRIEPRLRLSALFGPMLLGDWVKMTRELGASIASPHLMLISPAKVKEAHAHRLAVIPWTANTPAEWDKLVEAGVDAIISDDPAELIAYLRRKGLR